MKKDFFNTFLILTFCEESNLPLATTILLKDEFLQSRWFKKDNVKISVVIKI